MNIIAYFSATWHKYGETSAYVYKKKAIESHRVSSKNLQLMCYPKCMHAYQIWIALFFQLNEKQQNYHLNLTFKQNIEIPLLTTDKAVIVKALNSGFKDFEDALQSFSAEVSCEIDMIVTRNIKDYKYSSLIIISPDDFIKSFSI